MKSALSVNEHVVVEFRPVDDLAAVWAQPVWGAAKALLIVHDGASREAAARIAAGAAARSIACHVVEDLAAEADDLVACQRLLREACECRLGRRDCLIGLGSYQALARTATVGSWLRRSTKTIPIVRDPEVL